ncbi:MAG: deoxyribonuclease V [Chloroflexi bacterium]|nr:deoxyribonuclease V [Chloroflexota bacterium]
MHRWPATTAEAREIQLRLAGQISRVNSLDNPELAAGVDISPPDENGIARAAVVVLRLPELEVAEVGTAAAKPGFPYIPGLLSFRESPLIVSAWQQLKLSPDFLIVDGHGVAHPRRMGIASHLGLLLGTPTIGCAKSVLVGKTDPPGPNVGDWSPLEDKGEVIGAALRTRRGVKPIYVSIGHKVDLDSAMRWTLACCRGYRLPEGTRLAHLAAAGRLSCPQMSGKV